MKGYSFPRKEQAVSCWNLMKLSLNGGGNEALLDDHVQVEKIYEASIGHKMASEWTHLIDLDRLYDRRELDLSLVTIWKSFRRNMERRISFKYRKYLNAEKMGFIYLGPLRGRGDEFLLFLAWRTFWRNTAGLGNRSQIYRAIDPVSQNGIWGGKNTPCSQSRFWLPAIIREYNKQVHEVVSIQPVHGRRWGGRSAVSNETISYWSSQHTFAVYLLALRDESRSIAGSLLSYGFGWPYSNFPSLGLLTSSMTSVIDDGRGRLDFSAWRPVQYREEVDYYSRQQIWEAKQRRSAAKLKVNNLRP
jgi:hypothetical protein